VALSSVVRVHLGASLLVLEQGFQYKLNVHLGLNVFYDAPNFTRTELDVGRLNTSEHIHDMGRATTTRRCTRGSDWHTP
jgi:hypothetical protein